MNKTVRLQVALSRAGISSRRKAAFIIEEGRVSVNGKVIQKRSYRVDPAKDKIVVDNNRIKFRTNIYVLLNKPKGVITSRYDPEGRKTVFDIVPTEFKKLHTVGRLDKDTTGILLLTDDGNLTYRLTHPKFEIRKKYRVYCRGRIEGKEKKRLERGMVIGGRKTARAKVTVIRTDVKTSVLFIEIHEGRKRQIRDMFLFLGHPIKKLERIGYEFLKLGALKKGEFRLLSSKEVEKLKTL
jgi:pseudouridine synthase